MSADRLTANGEHRERLIGNGGLGWIEVYTGPMFASKSKILIAEVKQADRSIRTMVEKGLITDIEAENMMIVFKPNRDDRRDENTINSYDGDEWPAITVANSSEIESYIEDKPNVAIVAVDEAQFFDMELAVVLKRLAKKGIRVMVAGLDANFKGESFGPMGEVLVAAQSVHKLEAVCTVCGSPHGTCTQRMIVVPGKDPVPADYDDPIILVGSSFQPGTKEFYETRCLEHHEVPRANYIPF